MDARMKQLLKAVAVPEDKIEAQHVLAAILDRLYSKEDADLILRIGKDGGAIPELAEKLGMNESDTYKTLNNLFIQKGFVYPEPDKLRGMVVWRPTKCFMLHDFVFMHPRYKTQEHKELWDLLDEYYETVMGPVLASSGRTLFRVVPVNKTIEAGSTVLPYEDAAAIVEKSRKIALAECVCRKRARDCDHPLEVCLSFDIAADIMLQREISREITKKEALEVLRISEEAGLLHCVDNRQSGFFFICNCCSCGCGAVRTVTEHGSRNAIVPSRFKAVVDVENCSRCGSCIEKCQFGAIAIDANGIHLDEALCYGCGNCATNCPIDVIVMKEVRPHSHIPEKGDSFMGF